MTASLQQSLLVSVLGAEDQVPRFLLEQNEPTFVTVFPYLFRISTLDTVVSGSWSPPTTITTLSPATWIDAIAPNVLTNERLLIGEFYEVMKDSTSNPY